jgi:hypothetical protein
MELKRKLNKVIFDKRQTQLGRKRTYPIIGTWTTGCPHAEYEYITDFHLLQFKMNSK